MMIEHWDLKQHKIRLEIIQFFSILMLFDLSYAKPSTAQYAACNFMMLTTFFLNWSSFCFQIIILEIDLAFSEVNSNALISFNCTRSGPH